MPMTDEKYVDVDGARTRYFEAGDGEPMVLVHGADYGSTSANCAADWDLNFDGLAKWCRVFAIDKLGQGHTDNPKRDRDYTMAAQVGHVVQFIKTLGLENVHLVGHSRGGYLVGRLTLEHPELVKTCTIVDSNTLGPGTGRNDIVHANTPEPLYTRDSLRWVLERYSYSSSCVTEAWLDALADVASQPRFKETVEKMYGQGLRKSVFLPQLQRDKDETHGWLVDRGLQRPTLLIWGYNDPTATLDQGYKLYEFLALKERRTTMQIFNQAGHFTYREQPEAFNAALRGFIASN